MLLMPFRFGCSATVLLFLFILSLFIFGLFIFRLFFRGLLFGRISAMLLMRLRLSRGAAMLLMRLRFCSSAAMLLRCALVLTLRFPLFHPFVLTRMGLL